MLPRYIRDARSRIATATSPTRISRSVPGRWRPASWRLEPRLDFCRRVAPPRTVMELPTIQLVSGMRDYLNHGVARVLLLGPNRVQLGSSRWWFRPTGASPNACNAKENRQKGDEFPGMGFRGRSFKAAVPRLKAIGSPGVHRQTMPDCGVRERPEEVGQPRNIL